MSGATQGDRGIPRPGEQRPEQSGNLSITLEARYSLTTAPELLSKQPSLVLAVRTLLSDRLALSQPQELAIPQNQALHAAWRERFQEAVDRHPLTEETGLAREERLTKAYEDLIPMEYATATAEAIGDIFTAFGITLTTDRIEAAHDTHYDNLPGTYERATNLNLLLVNTAQAILGQESPIPFSDVLHIMLPTDQGVQLTEEQRGFLQETLQTTLAEVAQTYGRPAETLLQDSAEEIAVKPENLALYADVTTQIKQLSRVDDAMVDTQLVGMHLMAAEALIGITGNNILAFITMNEAQKAAVARLAQVEDQATVASLSPREYVERRLSSQYLPDITIDEQHLLIAGIVLSLAEALHMEAQPLPTERPQSPVDAYKLFVDRSQQDIAAIPAAIDRYFGESDEGNTRPLEERAARFSIPTEGRTREEIARDMQAIGNIVWLTLAGAMRIGIPQEATGTQIRDAVTTALNSISQNDIALDPETERVMRAVDQVAQTPNVTATYGLGWFQRSISVPAFNSQGEPITQPQLEKLVRGRGGRGRRRRIRQQGFVN